MNRYSAQKQYWKAKQTKQDKDKIADVVLLQKLQVSGSEGPGAGSAHELGGRWHPDLWWCWFGMRRDSQLGLG